MFLLLLFWPTITMGPLTQTKEVVSGLFVNNLDVTFATCFGVKRSDGSHTLLHLFRGHMVVPLILQDGPHLVEQGLLGRKGRHEAVFGCRLHNVTVPITIPLTCLGVMILAISLHEALNTPKAKPLVGVLAEIMIFSTAHIFQSFPAGANEFFIRVDPFVKIVGCFEVKQERETKRVLGTWNQALTRNLMCSFGLLQRSEEW